MHFVIMGCGRVGASLARAIERAGHEVAVAARPALVGMVESAGLRAFATGDPTLDPAPVRRPLRPIDPAAEDRVLVEGFAGVVARDRAGALAARDALNDGVTLMLKPP